MTNAITERPFYRHDIVCAKSGGHEMVVVALDGDDVVCEWVELEVIIERETYAPEEIVLVRRA